MVKNKVEENIAFHLKLQAFQKPSVKLAELIDLVGLTGREKSYPSQLSGGQSKESGLPALANEPEASFM